MSLRAHRRPRAPVPRDEQGSATAEFAVVLPAVVLVIALTIGGLAAAGRQVRLEHGAAQAVRLAARGGKGHALRLGLGRQHLVGFDFFHRVDSPDPVLPA